MKKFFLFLLLVCTFHTMLAQRGTIAETAHIDAGILPDTIGKMPIIIRTGNKVYNGYLYNNQSAIMFSKMLPISATTEKEYNVRWYDLTDKTIPADTTKKIIIRKKLIGYYPARNAVIISCSDNTPNFSVIPIGWIEDGVAILNAMDDTEIINIELK
jgi:hypothetical protein